MFKVLVNFFIYNVYKQFLLENSSFFVDYSDNYIKDKTYIPIGEVVAM